MIIFIFFAIAYLVYGSFLVWSDFNNPNLADRPVYTMRKPLDIAIIIRAIFTRPYLIPLHNVKLFLAEIKRGRETEKAENERRLEIARTENAQALEDLKKTEFFENNVENFDVITGQDGHLPIEAREIGSVLIDKKNKTIKIEIKQTGTKCVSEGGSIYQVPCYSAGNLICKNADYKIIESEYGDAVFMRKDNEASGKLVLGDNVFNLCNDKNNPQKLSLTISVNLKGLIITCDKISVNDFKAVKITDLDEYRDIEVGCSYGKYFSIQYEN